MNKRGGSIVIGLLLLVASIVIVLFMISVPEYISGIEVAIGFVVALMVALLGLGEMMREETRR